MQWEAERWVKLYTRDSADWLFLSFEAQAVFLMLLRKVDRAGILPFGRYGREGVPTILGHRERRDTILDALQELEQDGCIVITDDHLVIRNFLEAQEAKSSPAERKRRERERDRAQALEKREESRAVTHGHAESLLDETRREEEEKKEALSADADPLRSVGSIPEPPSLFALPDRRKPEVTLEAIQALWAELAPQLPQFKITASRRDALRPRCRDHPKILEWRMAIERISKSDFCNGQNDRGWKADIDFLLRRDTLTKALEGKYDNANPTKPNQSNHPTTRILK